MLFFKVCIMDTTQVMTVIVEEVIETEHLKGLIAHVE